MTYCNLSKTSWWETRTTKHSKVYQQTYHKREMWLKGYTISLFRIRLGGRKQKFTINKTQQWGISRIWSKGGADRVILESGKLRANCYSKHWSASRLNLTLDIHFYRKSNFQDPYGIAKRMVKSFIPSKLLEAQRVNISQFYQKEHEVPLKSVTVWLSALLQCSVKVRTQNM